jgi:2'-5' RNA ligase
VQSIVIVPVPEAEPLVSRWRRRYDPSTKRGMQPHITVVYPFLRGDRLTAGVLGRLGDVCASLPVLEVTFERTARFPRVLYLEPSPADGLRAVTIAVAREWPEAPPHGGDFDKVVPHLSVARGVRRPVMDAIDAELSPLLPLSATLTRASLCVLEEGRWLERASLPFGG